MGWIFILFFLYVPFIIFILSEYKSNIKSERLKIEEEQKEKKEKEKEEAEKKFNQTYFEPYASVLKNHFKSIDFLTEDTQQVFKQYYKELIKLDVWEETLSESLLYDCMYWTNRRYCFLDHLNNEKDINKHSKKLAPYFKATRIYYAIRKLNDEEEHLLFKIDKKRAAKVPDFYLPADSPGKYYQEICRFANINKDISIKNSRTLYYRGHWHLAYQRQTPETPLYALKLYLHYLSVKSYSPTYKYSKHRFTFYNQAKEQAFNNICEQLMHDDDLDNAFTQLDELLYTIFPDDPKPEPPRKKIKLNVSSIKQAKTKQKEVAELLGEYLNEEDIENNISADLPSALITPDNTNSNQEELFQLFCSNAFRLSMEEMNGFAQLRGLFTEAFIESINEQYYETLDDLLIEEDEDSYILNREYLERIIKK